VLLSQQCDHILTITAYVVEHHWTKQERIGNSLAWNIMLTLAEVWKSDTKTTYQIHNMSKELIKLIKKNPKLIDEYRAFIVKSVIDYQAKQTSQAKN
jgi:hypothetical protein